MSNFSEKEAWFSDPKYWSFSRVSASDFYRDIFPVGTFEERMGRREEYPKTNRGNGFLVYQTADGKKHTRMVFDDLREIFEYQDNPCVFMSPISYFGKNRTARNARYLYALTFDLDDVGGDHIRSFWNFHIYHEHYPIPTYIVNSGGGVHLYYVFERPVPMIPKNQKALKILKYALTERMWNVDTSGLEKVQYQGLNQGFRLVGSRTKNGEVVTCWRTGGRVSVEHLADFIPPVNKADVGILCRMWNSSMPLEKARERYPEWYRQRIVMGRSRMSWTCKRALYDWWKRKIGGASEHHRYWYVFALAVYAAKCGVDFEEVRRDAFGFKKRLNDLVPGSPFTDDDILAALKAYDEEHRSFTRREIAKVTAIRIPKNKRNGRKQITHLKMARAIQVIQDEEKGTKWNGRKSVQKVVFEYLDMYPKATYKEFCDATGLKKSVFYKYRALWKAQPM